MNNLCTFRSVPTEYAYIFIKDYAYKKKGEGESECTYTTKHTHSTHKTLRVNMRN